MAKQPYTPSVARSDAEWLAALADPTRLRLVDALLRDGPQSVGGLAEAVGAATVNVSHHLKLLRHAGIVEDARSGSRVICSLSAAVAGRTLTNGRVSVTL